MPRARQELRLGIRSKTLPRLEATAKGIWGFLHNPALSLMWIPASCCPARPGKAFARRLTGFWWDHTGWMALQGQGSPDKAESQKWCNCSFHVSLFTARVQQETCSAVMAHFSHWLAPGWGRWHCHSTTEPALLLCSSLHPAAARVYLSCCGHRALSALPTCCAPTGSQTASASQQQLKPHGNNSVLPLSLKKQPTTKPQNKTRTQTPHTGQHSVLPT